MRLSHDGGISMQIFEDLEAPCTYQGGKQRLAPQIVELMYSRYDIGKDTKFYDLCSGSGAVSLYLLNSGFDLENLVMLDKSSFGLFYKMLGLGKFDLSVWWSYVKQVPEKEKIKEYLEGLCKTDANEDEVYKFILLQAGAFGGKQIYKDGVNWKNTSFRGYWTPTETSNRKSPVNPMHPMIDELNDRVHKLAANLIGLKAYHCDIYEILKNKDFVESTDKVIYIDPPYINTTKYGYSFDLLDFLTKLREVTGGPVLISEGVDLRTQEGFEDLVTDAVKLKFNNKKGGISGNRKKFNEEWLNFI